MWGTGLGRVKTTRPVVSTGHLLPLYLVRSTLGDRLIICSSEHLVPKAWSSESAILSAFTEGPLMWIGLRLLGGGSAGERSQAIAERIRTRVCC